MVFRPPSRFFADASKLLAWLGLFICVAGASAGYVLFMSSGSPPPSVLTTLLSFLAFPAIGALIVSRRPQSTVGWIFCVIGLGTGTTAFAGGFVCPARHRHWRRCTARHQPRGRHRQ